MGFIKEMLENIRILGRIEPLRLLINGFLISTKAVVQHLSGFSSPCLAASTAEQITKLSGMVGLDNLGSTCYMSLTCFLFTGLKVHPLDATVHEVICLPFDEY